MLSDPQDQIFETTDFAALLSSTSQMSAKSQIGERLVALSIKQRPAWLGALVGWLALHGPKSLRPNAKSLLQAIPSAAPGRISAVQLTLQASMHHGDFRRWISDADSARDRHDLAASEFAYWQALKLFPLHAGYRVQYAHMLKDQGKYLDAVIHYCFALATGAPQFDVEEHLLFAAHRAGTPANSWQVQQLAAAWTNFERTEDDWDAPPVEKDYVDFARLFWGNTGLVTPLMLRSYVLECRTRRALFLALLADPETLRHNRQFFVMMNEREAANV